MRRERATGALRLSVQFATERPVPSRDRVRRWVRAALAVLESPAAEHALTLRFVDADEARVLNRDFRGKDYATNVLTFAYGHDDAPDGGIDETSVDATEASGAVEADIVVCMPVVEREAAEQRKDPMDHCAHLVVHGVLHAAGFDHETPVEAEAMESLERVALARFRIADPYVAR